jgi:hypothetical protein
VGRLTQGRGGRWEVCYAGEKDHYGGVVILFRPGEMTAFHPGQVVRVAGDLLDPEPHEIKPGYRVRSLQAVTQ